MIRFVLVALILLLYLILGIPVLLIEWVIGRWNPRLRDISCLRMVQTAFKLILWVTGADITYIGREQIPKDQAVLYICNHNSYFDILLTYSQCPDLTGYVAKSEMLRYPLLRDWMKRLYCLFLDRTDIRAGLQTILTGIDHIKNGISICIFPEGTRNDGEELSMLDFKDGAFKIATKTGCAIVPISINNMADMFEAHLSRVKKTHVVIEYGQPIYPDKLDKDTKKHIGNYVKNIIQETINKNAALV